jgi:LemA protein
MAFGYKEKANFSVDNEKEIAKPPSVVFDSAATPTKVEASGASR